MSSLSFVFSCETLASSPAASSQPVKLNLQTYLAAIQSRPPPAVGSFKVLPYKKCGDVHEKFDFLENTRFKTLEHLLKAF